MGRFRRGELQLYKSMNPIEIEKYQKKFPENDEYVKKFLESYEYNWVKLNWKKG